MAGHNMDSAGSWDALDWTAVEAVTRSLPHGANELLLEAEDVIAEGHGVVLVNMDVAGMLLVTNFRLLFVSEGSRKLIPLGTIPLATIEKFSKQVARGSPISRPWDKVPLQRLLQVVGKDMRIILFGFRPRTKQRRAVFDGLMRHMRPSRLWDLYAFTCGPSMFKNSDPTVRLHREYLRLLGKNASKSTGSFYKDKMLLASNQWWRITDVNSTYTLSSTYPSLFITPLSISDEEARQAANFRARGRLPVITWCHPENGAVLARSSQPLVGIMMNTRSNADEKLVGALCTKISGNRGQRRYFRIDPLPGRNALVPSQPGEKVVVYPARPVDTSTDFDGTNTSQSSRMASSGNAGSGSVVTAARQLPQQMPLVGMSQRMQNANMSAYNLSAQTSMSGTNSNNLPLQRGPSQQQSHQQARRKEPSSGIQSTGYPPQPKSRRM